VGPADGGDLAVEAVNGDAEAVALGATIVAYQTAASASKGWMNSLNAANTSAAAASRLSFRRPVRQPLEAVEDLGDGNRRGAELAGCLRDDPVPDLRGGEGRISSDTVGAQVMNRFRLNSAAESHVGSLTAERHPVEHCWPATDERKCRGGKSEAASS
jgi:hypothetical protein